MFGDNIKAIRLKRNYGINELSRLSGVNASYISALERDEKKNPSIIILEKLAKALEVPLSELMKVEPLTESELNDIDKKYSGLNEDASLIQKLNRDSGLQRIKEARSKMSDKEKDKMMKILEASFDEFFK